MFTKEDGEQMPESALNFPGERQEILKEIGIIPDWVITRWVRTSAHGLNQRGAIPEFLSKEKRSVSCVRGKHPTVQLLPILSALSFHRDSPGGSLCSQTPLKCVFQQGIQAAGWETGFGAVHKQQLARGRRNFPLREPSGSAKSR